MFDHNKIKCMWSRHLTPATPARPGTSRRQKDSECVVVIAAGTATGSGSGSGKGTQTGRPHIEMGFASETGMDIARVLRMWV